MGRKDFTNLPRGDRVAIENRCASSEHQDDADLFGHFHNTPSGSPVRIPNPPLLRGIADRSDGQDGSQSRSAFAQLAATAISRRYDAYTSIGNRAVRSVYTLPLRLFTATCVARRRRIMHIPRIPESSSTANEDSTRRFDPQQIRDT